MIRITSERGTVLGTKLVDTDTGAEIKGVESLKIDFPRADAIVCAEVRLGLVKTDVEAHPRYFAFSPTTGDLMEISGFILPDGTKVLLPGLGNS